MHNASSKQRRARLRHRRPFSLWVVKLSTPSLAQYLFALKHGDRISIDLMAEDGRIFPLDEMTL